MTYSLSHQQKQAVRIMWADLGYYVGKIVDIFEAEGYPVTEVQVARIILEDRKMRDERTRKLSHEEAA